MMRKRSFPPPRRTQDNRPCTGTASVAVLNLAACLSLLLLVTLSWRHIPLTDPSAGTAAGVINAGGHDLAWWDVHRFRHHVETRLPQYRRQFEEAARIHGIPWMLLAAQGYQESRWDRHAVSPTGVRGIMMLTRSTASSLGIRNRTDPVKSIEGGARYLAGLERQISNQSNVPERMWIALAAYNVGMGHIRDAQRLARRMGKNPHAWGDLKTTLPLVSQKQYYTSLPHGYARGWEPVRYVKRIRVYHAMLERHFRQI